MGLKTRTKNIIGESIRTLEDFRRGNVSGGAPTSGTGRLPAGTGYGAAFHAGRILYVIRSYGTPVAWLEWTGHDSREWIMPDAAYSVTTTQHQNAIRAELRFAMQEANRPYRYRDGDVNTSLGYRDVPVTDPTSGYYADNVIPVVDSLGTLAAAVFA